MFTYKELVAFVTLIDNRYNYEKAGKELKLSRQNISAAVCKVQNKISYPLFVRDDFSGRRRSLTIHGRALLKHARVIIKEFKALKAELK
jgi:DNA-binding transcriptional LysR family regulator